MRRCGTWPRGHLLGEDCTEETPRDCEISTALGMAEAIGTQADVDVSEVRALVESGGEISERQAEQAVRAVVGRLPGNFRAAGDELLAVAFGA